MPSPQAPDAGAQLMLRFQKGDEGAFTELFREYKAQVFQLAFRYVNDPAYAEDLVSETFLRVYRAKESYRPTAKFATWVYRIAANLCLNELRSHKRWVSLDAGEEDEERPKREWADVQDPGPSGELAQSETGAAVAAALQSLPETQRMLVILVYYQDLPIHEAAQAAGISAVGARLRLFRARAALKKALNKYEEK